MAYIRFAESDLNPLIPHKDSIPTTGCMSRAATGIVGPILYTDAVTRCLELNLMGPAFLGHQKIAGRALLHANYNLKCNATDSFQILCQVLAQF